jgi:transketolase
VIRPGDPNEAVAAWRVAIERRDGPTALILSRQKLPVVQEDRAAALDGVRRGGYILAEAMGPDGAPATPRVILIATGSELHLAVAAREVLQAAGTPTRVVSLPCWERFGSLSPAERDAVLPPAVTKRVSIEAGVSLGWDRWTGHEGAIMAIDTFGLSAPGPEVMEAFGMTVDRVVEVANGVVSGSVRGVVARDPHAWEAKRKENDR